MKPSRFKTVVSQKGSFRLLHICLSGRKYNTTLLLLSLGGCSVVFHFATFWILYSVLLVGYFDLLKRDVLRDDFQQDLTLLFYNVSVGFCVTAILLVSGKE